MKTKTKVQQRYEICEKCLSDRIDPEIKSLCRIYQIVEKIKNIKTFKYNKKWYNVYKNNSREICVGCKHIRSHQKLMEDDVVILIYD